MYGYFNYGTTLENLIGYTDYDNANEDYKAIYYLNREKLKSEGIISFIFELHTNVSKFNKISSNGFEEGERTELTEIILNTYGNYAKEIKDYLEIQKASTNDNEEDEEDE